MKAKTKKKLERTVVILLVLIFVLGTILLYLPVGTTPAPGQTQSAPPVQSDAAAQQPAGTAVETAVPGS